MTPTQTVVEYAPSGGWYSEILAPLVRDHGTFYALQPSGSYLDGYKSFLASNPVYDQVKLVAFPEESASIPAGSVDTVLTFRNVHNLVMSNKAAEALEELIGNDEMSFCLEHKLDHAIGPTLASDQIKTVSTVSCTRVDAQGVRTQTVITVA